MTDIEKPKVRMERNYGQRCHGESGWLAGLGFGFVTVTGWFEKGKVETEKRCMEWGSLVVRVGSGSGWSFV